MTDDEKINRFRQNQFKMTLKNAVQFSLDSTQSGYPTISIEMAPIILQGKTRKGDWQNRKLSFQLNPDSELIIFFQVLNRIINKEAIVSLAYHGSDNKKSMLLGVQKSGALYVGIKHLEKNLSVIIPQYAFPHINTLVVKAFSYRYNISVSDAFVMLQNSPVCQYEVYEKPQRHATS